MTLERAIELRKVPVIRSIIKTMTIPSIVDLLSSLPTNEILIFFRLLKTKSQSEIFSKLDFELQEKIISSFNNDEAKEILSDLYLDDIVDLIEEVPANIAIKILSNTPLNKRKEVNKLLKYNDNQTGSFMSVDIIKLKQYQLSSEAINLIRNKKDESEVARYFFVTDKKGKLVGFITIEELIFAKNNLKIKEIMKPIIPLKTTTNIDVAVEEFKKYDYSALPVVNSNGFLVGMVTSDDVIDVISHEYSEDFQKMAGIDAIDTPYLKTTILRLVRSRVIWLLLLMISATLSQIVLDVFISITSDQFSETIVGQITTTSITTALVAIIPVISGAAGNAGSQASTMITRSLAIREIKLRDYKKVFWRELRIGFIVGFILCIANLLRLIIYYLIKEHSLNNVTIWISLGASISLWLVIVFAKLVGGMLPMLAKMFKQDPAVMAAPLLTTIIDALSTLCFFSINIGILLLAL